MNIVASGNAETGTAPKNPPARDVVEINPRPIERSVPSDWPWHLTGDSDGRQFIYGIDVTDVSSEQQELMRAAEADPRLKLLNPAILDGSRAVVGPEQRLFDPRQAIDDCFCQNDPSRQHRGTIQTYVSNELHRKVTVGHVPFPLLDRSVYKGVDIYDGLSSDDRVVHLSEIGRRLSMRTRPQIPGVEGIKVLTIYSVMWLGALTFDEERIKQSMETALRESGCPNFSFASEDSAEMSGMYL